MAISGLSSTTGDTGALDALRDSSGSALRDGSTSALRARAATDPKAAIKMAAKQFEAIFMQQLLKSMRESSLGTGMLDNSCTQMGTEMLDTQLSNKMSGMPGGLADVIARQLERQMSGIAPRAAVPAASAAGAPVGEVASVKPNQQEFLRMHTEAAAGAEAETGIPASFMVAQAAHESGWGRREIRNADGTSAHNLFGIKAGASWRGKVAQVMTTEVIDGQPRKVLAKFRAYASYDESFRDYAQLMKNNPRYAKVLTAGNDAKGFAQGLQRAGYATDPAYADKLTRVINTTLRMQRAALQSPQSLA